MIDVVAEKLGDYRWNVFLVPDLWGVFSCSPTLVWKKVPFSAKSKNRIPKKSGLYAFVASGKNAQLPQHGYIMYIGESGATSGRTLRARYTDYLQWDKKEKRPVVREMFRRLGNALYFYFAPINSAHLKKIAGIETSLLDTLLPPCNETGFSIIIARARKVLWRK